MNYKPFLIAAILFIVFIFGSMYYSLYSAIDESKFIQVYILSVEKNDKYLYREDNSNLLHIIKIDTVMMNCVIFKKDTTTLILSHIDFYKQTKRFR